MSKNVVLNGKLVMGGGSSKQKVSEEEKYNLDTKDEYNYAKAYPRTDVGQCFTLKNNRKIGYCIYGQTENYKATLILFPGSPGTRLFNYEAHDNINRAYGIRMIVLDRPGIGLSSTHKDFTFKSYANDVYQLIQYLQLKSYHIAAYSAGGPFACTFAALYSSLDLEYKLLSFSLIAGVGPPNSPKVYGQMSFINKVGWFIVRNGNKTIIDLAANVSESTNKPIESLIDEMSRNEYDKEMIKNPNILKTFLQSKYETESIDKTRNDKDINDKSENRLLLLYGLQWGIKLQDIKCPFYVYNGTNDVACVPNMAIFMFETCTGKKAPDMPIKQGGKKRKKEDKEKEKREEEKKDIDIDKKNANVVSVELNEDDDDDDNDEEEKKQNDENRSILNVDAMVMEKLEKEYIENETMNNVRNKQSKLIWGEGKGHLWYFELDLWRELVFRTIFIQQK